MKAAVYEGQRAHQGRRDGRIHAGEGSRQHAVPDPGRGLLRGRCPIRHRVRCLEGRPRFTLPHGRQRRRCGGWRHRPFGDTAPQDRRGGAHRSPAALREKEGNEKKEIENNIKQ